MHNYKYVTSMVSSFRKTNMSELSARLADLRNRKNLCAKKSVCTFCMCLLHIRDYRRMYI